MDDVQWGAPQPPASNRLHPFSAKTTKTIIIINAIIIIIVIIVIIVNTIVSIVSIAIIINMSTTTNSVIHIFTHKCCLQNK